MLPTFEDAHLVNGRTLSARFTIGRTTDGPIIASLMVTPDGRRIYSHLMYPRQDGSYQSLDLVTDN